MKQLHLTQAICLLSGLTNLDTGRLDNLYYKAGYQPVQSKC